MHFFGATIIAAIVFFVLNLGNSLIFGAPQLTTTAAVFGALIKTAIFATVFHYIHNWIAALFGWYRTDDPEAPHLFARNPALDAERAARRVSTPD